jgi:hypothetical protein
MTSTKYIGMDVHKESISLAESKKHPVWKRLCQIPSIGPIRAAVLLGHGKEYRESAKTDNEKKAAGFLRHRMKEVGADQLGIRTFVTPQASRLTIDNLLEALKG